MKSGVIIDQASNLHRSDLLLERRKESSTRFIELYQITDVV